jgi:hypothetical protein
MTQICASPAPFVNFIRPAKKGEGALDVYGRVSGAAFLTLHPPTGHRHPMTTWLQIGKSIIVLVLLTTSVVSCSYCSEMLIIIPSLRLAAVTVSAAPGLVIWDQPNRDVPTVSRTRNNHIAKNDKELLEIVHAGHVHVVQLWVEERMRFFQKCSSKIFMWCDNFIASALQGSSKTWIKQIAHEDPSSILHRPCFYLDTQELD